MSNDINLAPEGTPSYSDLFNPGSEYPKVTIPAGMSTMVNPARVNKHQNPSETGYIGVPGSTYSSSSSDRIIKTEAGHVLAFGNMPGNETVHLQSAAGAVIELSADGSIRISTKKGLHMSIGGDNQIALTGDFSLVTNGDFKLKAGSVIFDCHDFIVNASGNKVENITGDHNEKVYGDQHKTVGGDKSTIVGGDAREAVAGNFKSQVAGDRRMHTTGAHEQSSKGKMGIETKDKLNAVSEGAMGIGTKSTMTMQSEGNFSVDTKGTSSMTSAGAMTKSSQSTMTVKSDGAQTFSTKSTQTLAASGSTTIASGGNITQAATGTLKSSTSSGLMQATKAIGTVIAAITPTTPTDTATPNTNVADAMPTVPDKKTLVNLTTDLVITEGEMRDVQHAEGVYHNYKGDDGSGSDVPQGVKDKMQQEGIEYDKWAQKMQQYKPEGSVTIASKEITNPYPFSGDVA